MSSIVPIDKIIFQNLKPLAKCIHLRFTPDKIQHFVSFSLSLPSSFACIVFIKRTFCFILFIFPFLLY